MDVYQIKKKYSCKYYVVDVLNKSKAIIHRIHFDPAEAWPKENVLKVLLLIIGRGRSKGVGNNRVGLL